MPYHIVLEAGEELIGSFSLTLSKRAEPFVFAVTNQALFLPRKKFFAVKDPTYFERVPVRTVREVRVQRLRPYAMLVLAAIMIVVGGTTTFLMVRPLLKGKGGQVSGYPPALVVVGAVIPFAIRGRYGFVVHYGEKEFRWKPTISVDRKSRVATADLLTEIARACGEAGCRVQDERSALPQAQT
jgi:hypothetical protein